MKLSAISVLITTYNEEKNIERCLEPLRGFGEILLVDSHSTDRTLEIAARHEVRTVSRPYESAAKLSSLRAASSLRSVRPHPDLLLCSPSGGPDLTRELVSCHPLTIPRLWRYRHAS